MEVKYVVHYEGESRIIFDDVNDAQEYILSIAEEAVYEAFCIDTYMDMNVFWKSGESVYKNPEDWFSAWSLDKVPPVYIWRCPGWETHERQTRYSAMLMEYSEGYGINECRYFTGNWREDLYD